LLYFRGTSYIVAMLFVFLPLTVNAINVGSNNFFSRQPVATFPSNDIDNGMLGFASFNNGFGLEDNRTTCSFNSVMPVSSQVMLNGGKLYLFTDFVTTSSIDFLTAGRIYGNGRSIELNKQTNSFRFQASANSYEAYNLSTRLMNAAVNDLDWSPTNTYLIAASATFVGNELLLYYFDGSVLTQTQAANVANNRGINSVRWSPKDRYISAIRNTGGGNELFIYEWRPYNGTFVNTNGAGTAVNAIAQAWHPTGRFLLVGIAAAGNELLLYPFTPASPPTAPTLGGPTGFTLPGTNRNIARNGISWSPSRTAVIVGTVVSTTQPTLVQYNFNGTSLTLSTSLTTGFPVVGLDWSQTGTYIAVGLSGATQNIRVYQYTGGVLSEAQSARVAENGTINSVNWDFTGDYLLVSVTNGATYTVRVYAFDKTAKTLTLLNSNIISSSPVNIARWANRSSLLVARGMNDNRIVVSERFQLAAAQWLLNNVGLVCNSDVELYDRMDIEGTCKIEGRGNVLSFKNAGGFVLRPGAQLIIEDTYLDEVKEGCIRSLTDNGSVVLKNSGLMLARDYTFSRGSILFDEDVTIAGTNKFIYSSGLTSTIASQATLIIDQNMTFSYAPRRAQRELLYMTDDSSIFWLNGCTLHSTRTGLQLSRGTLIFDDKVTLSSDALNSGEACELGQDLNVKVLGNAAVNLYGRIKFS
jgi:hypothetical protein